MKISEQMKYRPDIDGLRAVAVLLVVGYHAFPDIVPAGFTGVDIFFVISGYLITTIIMDDLRQDRFSYRRFYARRIRRLYPALILVVLANICMGWLVLYPDEFARLGQHIVGGLAFVPNLVFWREDGYFDTASETKPLLHLWSLGIEEQFYVAWPVTLVMVSAVRGGTAKTIAVIAIASFWAQCYTLDNLYASSAFYLPTNRAWELLVGAGLACAGSSCDERRPGVVHRSGIRSLIGVFLLVTTMVVIVPGTKFGGFQALLPTVGAMFIISSPDTWLNQRLLSHRWLVYVGLISYPLYLWHWSLLSFTNILGTTSWYARTAAVLLSVCLAALTYEVLEKRVKRAPMSKTVRGLVASSVVLLCVGWVVSGGLILSRNNSDPIQARIEARTDWEYPLGLESTEIEGIDVYRKVGAEEVVLFFGDSHMEQYAPRIVRLIEQDPNNMKTAVFATRAGCHPIPSLFEDAHESCTAEFRQAVIDYALSPKVESVVIAASWTVLIKSDESQRWQYRYYYLVDGEKKYVDEDGIDYAFAAVEELLTSIARLKRVYLVLDIPVGPEFDPRNVAPDSRLWGTTEERVHVQQYPETQEKLRSAMITMAERANAVVIDPTEHLCQSGLCRIAEDDGTPIYKDAGHLRATYVREFADFMDVTIGR